MFNINGRSSLRHAPGLAAGTGQITYPEHDRVEQHDTVQCVHCSYTSVWVPGSERWWGWCGRCAGKVCGRVACQVRGCIPKERELDLLEKLVDWNHMRDDMIPQAVSVPRAVSGGIILG